MMELVRNRSGNVFGKVDNGKVSLSRPRKHSPREVTSRKETNRCSYCREKIEVGSPMFMTTTTYHQPCYYKKFHEDEMTRKYRKSLREYNTLRRMDEEHMKTELISVRTKKPLLRETSRRIILGEEEDRETDNGKGA